MASRRSLKSPCDNAKKKTVEWKYHPLETIEGTVRTRSLGASDNNPLRRSLDILDKQGSLVETLFGKMARTFLRGMRLASWQEMKERILRGIAEINQAPVVHRWSNFTAVETQG